MNQGQCHREICAKFRNSHFLRVLRTISLPQIPDDHNFGKWFYFKISWRKYLRRRIWITVRWKVSNPLVKKSCPNQMLFWAKRNRNNLCAWSAVQFPLVLVYSPVYSLHGIKYNNLWLNRNMKYSSKWYENFACLFLSIWINLRFQKAWRKSIYL